MPNRNFDFTTKKVYETTVEIDGKSFNAIVEECAKTFDIDSSTFECKEVVSTDIKVSDDIEINLNLKSDTKYFVIKGYANNKNVADSYGDIPTGKSVYDIKRLRKNPVMLIDHRNSAGRIMGNFTKLKEDDKGLYFEAVLKPLDITHDDFVKEVIQNYMSGFARALSIGGRWMYDREDPSKLIKAYLHEISGVAVGADGLALVSNTAKPKGEELESSKGLDLDELESLVGKYADGDTEALDKMATMVTK